MLHAFWATYAAVFAAEILGDKFLYTTGILSTRYRTPPMLIGIGIAFMAKMAVAVAVGDVLAGLPRALPGVVTASGMIWIALTFWRQSALFPSTTPVHSNAEATLVSCASVIFSEWADLGQVMAATMAARFQAPAVVWVGAVSAMMTKALLVAVAGAQLRALVRDRVPASIVRYGGVSLLVLLGGLSVIETLTARH